MGDFAENHVENDLQNHDCPFPVWFQRDGSSSQAWHLCMDAVHSSSLHGTEK